MESQLGEKTEKGETVTFLMEKKNTKKICREEGGKYKLFGSILLCSTYLYSHLSLSLVFILKKNFSTFDNSWSTSILNPKTSRSMNIHLHYPNILSDIP